MMMLISVRSARIFQRVREGEGPEAGLVEDEDTARGLYLLCHAEQSKGAG